MSFARGSSLVYCQHLPQLALRTLLEQHKSKSYLEDTSNALFGCLTISASEHKVSKHVALVKEQGYRFGIQAHHVRELAMLLVNSWRSLTLESHADSPSVYFVNISESQQIQQF